jgi:O-antigen ligase
MGEPAVTATEKLFSFGCGTWIGLSLLKFGNPIIFDQMIGEPKNFAEFVFTPWPVGWGYVLLAVVAAAAFPVLKFRFSRPLWPIAFLGFWLFWQFLSHTRSIDPKLSQPTLIHFVSCAVAFLLGHWTLGRLQASKWFWGPLLACLFYVLFAGFEQHAGGLEATRKAFYAQPNWEMYPKDYLLKIESNRIFSTLVYPNALAGVLLLLLPAALWQVWQVSVKWPKILRGVAFGLFAYLGVACFYWSGSKGGWLIALVLGGVLALHTSIPRRLKVALVVVGILLGLSAFFIRFSAYFEKGATSVGARFGYWAAAVEIAKTRPILGSGPGTFSVLFKQLKPPEAEMARLVHNDYLEQASDSGLPGGIAFFGGIFGLLWYLYRKHSAGIDLGFLLWLGLLGWALQGFIEFGLYIPALAWPAFLFLGSLATSGRVAELPSKDYRASAESAGKKG